ncbi:hypothetical protein T492DRAFT_887409 [Pavlovales sp. CCMP2436]|nr:hypothetical protein T492DRAFT_887409 [Pavlovales sp. CCMP2436]
MAVPLAAEVVEHIVLRIITLARLGERNAGFLVHGGPSTGKSTLAAVLALALLPLLPARVLHGREEGALEAAIVALELAQLQYRQN